MVRRLLESLVVWIVVSIIVWLVARLLLAIGTDVTQTIGGFLNGTSVIIGLAAGLWYFFFGNTYRDRWSR